MTVDDLQSVCVYIYMLFTPVYVVCLHVLFVPYWCLHVDAYNEVLYQLAVTQADILYCSPVDSLVNETPSWMDVAPWCYSWDGLGLDWIYLGGMRYWAPYGVSNFANRLVLQDNILQSSISINHLLLEIKSIVKCIATSGRGPCVLYVLPADILLQSSLSPVYALQRSPLLSVPRNINSWNVIICNSRCFLLHLRLCAVYASLAPWCVASMER